MKYYCQCGHYFDAQYHLREHIGICNPHWPRTSPNDEHKQVTKAEWNTKRNAAYARLRNDDAR